MTVASAWAGMDPASVKFGQTLGQSNLLDSEEMMAALAKLREGRGKANPLAVATWLVDQGMLSRWQAEQLLGGRTAFCLGKYKLIEKIGSGGMGAVYKAEQMGFGRIVALKLMGQELLQKPGSLDRFLREIQLVSKLQHPNIVGAIDADQVAGRHFLILEYVQGQDLEQILQKTGRLPVGTACEAIMQAAAGLQHAYERGVVHRDIKPGNLLVTQGADGRFVVKILDMGLGRFTQGRGDASLTKSGQIMGTPDYMAPEQVEDTRKVDTRADIYSLGSSLFEMLTGKVPFEGGAATRRLMARLAGEAPRLRSVAPEMPEALDKIVAKMIARNPEKRYATPGEVAAALAPFAISGGAVLNASGDGNSAVQKKTQALSSASLGEFAAVASSESSTSIGLQAAVDTSLDEFDSLLRNLRSTSAETSLGRGLAEREEEEAKGWRWKVLAGVVLLVAALGGYGWYELGATQLVVEVPKDERTGSLQIDGGLKEYSKSGVMMFSGRPGERRIQITRVGYEPIDMKLTLGRGEKKTFRPTWKPLPETARVLAWDVLDKEAAEFESLSPLDDKATGFWNKVLKEKANQAAFPEAVRALPILNRLKSPLSLYEAKDIAAGSFSPPMGEGVPLAAVFGAENLAYHVWRSTTALIFSLDSKKLLITTTGGTKIVDLQTSEQFSIPGVPAYCASISPNGQNVAIGKAAQTVVRSLGNGELIHNIPTPGHAYSVRYSPDGNRLIVGTSTGAVLIYDLTAPDFAKPALTLPPHSDLVYNVAFAPDGKSVLTHTDDQANVQQFDAVTGQLMRTYEGHRSYIYRFAVSKTGIMATCSSDTTARTWDVTTGKFLREFGGFGAAVTAVTFSPDGKYLVTADSNYILRVWEVDTGKMIDSATGHTYSILSLAFSPDGKLLVSGGADHTIRLWSFENELLEMRDTGLNPWLVSACVSGDCRMIAAGTLAGKLLIWDVPSSTPRVLAAHSLPINAVEFAPVGNLIATAARDARINIWDAKTGELKHSISRTSGSIVTIAFSPDGRHLASAGSDRIVRIWDIDTGEIFRELYGHEITIYGLAWRPDGKVLVSTDSNSQMRVWDINDGSTLQVRTFTRGPLYPLVYSPEGDYVAFPHYCDVRRWNLTDAADDSMVTTGQNIGPLDFSPDRKTLAYGSIEGIIRFVRTGKSNHTLDEWKIAGDFCPLDKLRYTSDGRFLLTSNPNGTAYLFRAEGTKQ